MQPFEMQSIPGFPGERWERSDDFSGSRRTSDGISPAKNFWSWLRILFKQFIRNDDLFQNREDSVSKDENLEKRGRPTIPDNLLVGARNAWVTLLEEHWPEVGWALKSVRNQRNSTIQDIRNAFAPFKDKPNAGLAVPFLFERPEPASIELVRKQRKGVSLINKAIQDAHSNTSELESRSNQAVGALESKDPNPKEIDIIETESIQRFTELIHLRRALHSLETRLAIDFGRLTAQEAHVFQTQMLEYLHSGRYAVEPLSIANGLAGLPVMRWRQSYDRCSVMPYESEPHLWYRVFELIEDIWKRQPEGSPKYLAEFFKKELEGLPKKRGYVREFTWKSWRYLRIAIEEFGESNDSASEAPFSISRNFLRNALRQQNLVEEILAKKEQITG